MTIPDMHPTNLNELGAEINEINRANGWEVPNPSDWDHDHRIPTLLCLIHSEISEALEGFRHRDKDNVGEELADTLIRVLDVGVGLGIDMDAIVRIKLAKNRERGYKHGGKRV